MVGIKSYGAYIPYYRLKKETASLAFGKGAVKGEKAVAYCDEDSFTMAVTAAKNAFSSCRKKNIEEVSFASVSPPYKEKMCASEIVAVLDICEDVRTNDFSGSLRAGSSAMLSAFESGKDSLITMSDTRLGAADGKFESELGDGACAFITGTDDLLAVLDGSVSVSKNAIDQWRSENDDYVRNWDIRYANSELYSPLVKKAVLPLMEKLFLSPKDYSKIVLYGHEEKNRLSLAAKLGFTPEQTEQSLYTQIGNTGNAAAGLMLISALENAKPGERILFVTYGEGADAMSFTVTEEILKYKPTVNIQTLLNHKDNTLPYGKYLKWKGMIDCEPQKRPAQERSALPDYFRNYKKNHNLYGSKCSQCGTVVFPSQRICVHCHSIDKNNPYPLADRVAQVRTFTIDGLSLSLDSPNILVVIEFEGGGKMMTYLVDCKKEDVHVGMKVKPAYRKMFEANGVQTYFWKVVPVMEEE